MMIRVEEEILWGTAQEEVVTKKVQRSNSIIRNKRQFFHVRKRSRATWLCVLSPLLDMEQSSLSLLLFCSIRAVIVKEI